MTRRIFASGFLAALPIDDIRDVNGYEIELVRSTVINADGRELF